MNFTIPEVWTEDEAAEFMLLLFEEHSIYGWSFEIEKGNLKRLGCTNYTLRTIFIGDWVFTDLNEEVEDTLLHELAHVLSPGGHGLKWKMTAKNVGAKPRDCFTNGIPQHLQVKIDSKDGESSGSCASKPEPEEPVSVQMAVIIEKKGSEFIAMQGMHYVCEDDDLKMCIAKCVAYCSERKAQLIVPFQQFVRSDIK